MIQPACGSAAVTGAAPRGLLRRLLRSDSVVSALEAKAAQMSTMHAGREQDWHNLANTWISYEKELTDAHKKWVAV